MSRRINWSRIAREKTKQLMLQMRVREVIKSSEILRRELQASDVFEDKDIDELIHRAETINYCELITRIFDGDYEQIQSVDSIKFKDGLLVRCVDE